MSLKNALFIFLSLNLLCAGLQANGGKAPSKLYSGLEDPTENYFGEYDPAKTGTDLPTLQEAAEFNRFAEEIWIGGSFLTEKIDPEDIDLVVIIDGEGIDNN